MGPAEPLPTAAGRMSVLALAFQSAAPAASPWSWMSVAVASGTSVTGAQGLNVTAGLVADGSCAQPIVAEEATATATAANSARESLDAGLKLRATGRAQS